MFANSLWKSDFSTPSRRESMVCGQQHRLRNAITPPIRLMEPVENAILRSATLEKPPRAGAEEAKVHDGPEKQGSSTEIHTLDLYGVIAEYGVRFHKSYMISDTCTASSIDCQLKASQLAKEQNESNKEQCTQMRMITTYFFDPFLIPSSPTSSIHLLVVET